MREKPSGTGPKEVKAPPRTGRAIRSSREPGMIRRPDAYEASALPSELSRRDGMPGGFARHPAVPLAGFEPAAYRSGGGRSVR